VVGRAFAGAQTRVRVAVAGAPELTLDLPGAGVDAPAVGERVRLRIDSGAVQALAR
jgi:hypothetical protein